MGGFVATFETGVGFNCFDNDCATSTTSGFTIQTPEFLDDDPNHLVHIKVESEDEDYLHEWTVDAYPQLNWQDVNEPMPRIRFDPRMETEEAFIERLLRIQ